MRVRTSPDFRNSTPFDAGHTQTVGEFCSRRRPLHARPRVSCRFIQGQCNNPLDLPRRASVQPPRNLVQDVSFGSAGTRPIAAHTRFVLWIDPSRSFLRVMPRVVDSVVARRRGREFGRLFWAVVCWCGANACSANFPEQSSSALGCEVGTVGCSCYGNWSCNYQLSCVDEICVDRRALAEEAELSALRSRDPVAHASSPECLTCLEEVCLASLTNCYAQSGCTSLFACLLGCSRAISTEYDECAAGCYSTTPLDGHSDATQVQLCAAKTCPAECHEP